MPEGLTDAQIIERLMRLERNVQRIGAANLLAERTGTDFIEAQRAVNALRWPRR